MPAAKINEKSYRILDPGVRYSEFGGLCALIVMAKVPKAGRVKTRLAPPLTPQQAAELNTAFLQDTIECLQEVGSSAMSVPAISFTPAGEEEGFRGIVPGDVPLI